MAVGKPSRRPAGRQPRTTPTGSGESSLTTVSRPAAPPPTTPTPSLARREDS